MVWVIEFFVNSLELSLPYCSLFNQSLRIGIIPSCCNEANVCPVPKKGDLSGISKCRSTQVLSSTQKIKFLKDLYSDIYVIIYVIIICFLRYNLYFCLATKPSINWHFFMIPLDKLLILWHQQSIRPCVAQWSTAKFEAAGIPEAFMLGLQIIFPWKTTSCYSWCCFWLDLPSSGFLRDRSLALFFFCCISVILLMTPAQIQSTLVISKSNEPSETLRDIRTSTYQMCSIEENTNGTTKFHKLTCNLTPLVRNTCWKYCEKGEKLLLRSYFSSYPQYFVTDVRFVC